MDVYGLTGGIGSGKSSVADLLESYGIPVVSADELSRIVVAHGSEGLRDVVAAFGPEILDDGHELDRRKLASIVFEDPNRRKELEAILHPRIRERFEQVLDALEKAGHDVAVYEVPLLFEKNLQTEMKAVILVTADDEVRIHRVQTRDDVTEAEVRARMAAQMDEEQKRRRADYIIENNGNFDELRREVEFMLERFMRVPSQRAKPPIAVRPRTVLAASGRTGVTSIFAPVPARPGPPRESAGDPSPSLGIRVDTMLPPKHPPLPASATPGARAPSAPPLSAAAPVAPMSNVVTPPPASAPAAPTSNATVSGHRISRHPVADASIPPTPPAPASNASPPAPPAPADPSPNAAPSSPSARAASRRPAVDAASPPADAPPPSARTASRRPAVDTASPPADALSTFRSHTPAASAPNAPDAAIPTLIDEDDVSAEISRDSGGTGNAATAVPPPLPSRVGKSAGAPLRREPAAAKTAPHRSAEVVPRRPANVADRPSAPPPPASLASPPPAPPLQPPPRPSALSGPATGTTTPEPARDRSVAQNDPRKETPGSGRSLSSGWDVKPGDEPPSET